MNADTKACIILDSSFNYSDLSGQHTDLILETGQIDSQQMLSLRYIGEVPYPVKGSISGLVFCVKLVIQEETYLKLLVLKE